MKLKNKYHNLWIYIFLVIMSLLFLIPFIMVVSISFTDENALNSMGYSIIPSEISLDAYKLVFKNPGKIIDAYIITTITSSLGTILSLLIMALVAYPLSRNDFKLRKPLTFFIFFTMLFGGGMIPTYILYTQYLHIGDTVWVYFVTGMASAWHIMIIRTFFQGLPESLIEATKVDGAGELRIFFSIVLPLSKPVLATIGMMTLLTKWNDWTTTMLYIRNSRLYSLQYLLQRILRETEFIQNMMESSMTATFTTDRVLPSESMRFAMAVVAAGPMLVIFPFFQKYFASGLTVGAVKG